jgi:hypothetical protein
MLSQNGTLYSADPAGVIKCLDKVAILVVNTPMLVRFSAQRLRHSPRRNSFPSILLPTLLRSQKSQTLCNQANPDSFCKTPGVAYLPASTSASAPSVLSANSVVSRWMGNPASSASAFAPSASLRYPFSNGSSAFLRSTDSQNPFFPFSVSPCLGGEPILWRLPHPPGLRTTSFRINTCKCQNK